MFNSNVHKSIVAGGATFALCLVAMLAGGLTWFTGAAGWCVFLAFVLSVFAAYSMWVQLNHADKQKWAEERNDTIDRLNDAQRCVRAEEGAHERTKRELVDVRQQLTQANTDASTAKREYESMRERAGQRGRTIDELQRRISSDNDTWRKQVSNLAESAYKMAVHIEGSANGLPDEWQEWGGELARDLRALASAGGVQVEPQDDRQLAMPIETVSRDAWATPADKLDAMQAVAFKAVPLPAAPTGPNPIDVPEEVAQPSQWQELTRLIGNVKENQHRRRALLDRIVKAVEQGYDISEEFNAAYHRGMLFVTDELIAAEVEKIFFWRNTKAESAAQQQQ